MLTETNVEQAVRERYSRGARAPERELCCAVRYDPALLEAIPKEVIERDYGCGDPTAYLKPGQTVLDLGSGAGKLCFIAAQIVGPTGRVIGIDVNAEMLQVARRYTPDVAARVGFSNVEFRRGRIQDLRTDFDAADRWLRAHPVAGVESLDEYEEFIERERRRAPLVASDSVDVVLSNCVLNLVRDSEKPRVMSEAFRVLRRGGRAVISDIVSDEPVPAHLKRDPELWSGCISGALEQGEFLEAFERAGFYGIEILSRDTEPWRTVEGIEFRSITVSAWKGKQGPCLDLDQAVIYRGPWRKVEDDDGHTLVRGKPMAVCGKTFRLYTSEPYADDVIAVPPRVEVDPGSAPVFDCSRDAIRDPRETKGADYRASTAPAGDGCCNNDGCCG